MAMTDLELLTATREAIEALTVKGASSYAINGRSFTALDLDTLWCQVDRLERRVARAAGRKRPAVIRFREPS